MIEEANQWFTGSVFQSFSGGLVTCVVLGNESVVQCVSGFLIDQGSESVVHWVRGSVVQWGSGYLSDLRK